MTPRRDRWVPAEAADFDPCGLAREAKVSRATVVFMLPAHVSGALGSHVARHAGELRLPRQDQARRRQHSIASRLQVDCDGCYGPAIVSEPNDSGGHRPGTRLLP
jgi:hypothetical protein